MTYFRLLNLLVEITKYTNIIGNLKAHAYIKTNINHLQNLLIEKNFENKEDKIEKMENFILSPSWLNQKCFTDLDRDYIKTLIRDYKLTMIIS
jgi:hypothetical protein